MVEAARTCSNQWRALIRSWVTPPTTGVIKIERGGDENLTMNHGCGGGDCGGGSNSGGDGGGDGGEAATAAMAEAEKAMVALATAGSTTMETMTTTMAVMAEAKATTSQQ